MGKPRAANHLSLYTEPYPEHSKMYPYSQFAIIEEFFDHLREVGITDLTWVEVHYLILDFKGVDRQAYEAEGADMKVKYRWLFEQFGLIGNQAPEPRLRITTDRQVPKPAVEEPPSDGLDFLLAKIRER